MSGQNFLFFNTPMAAKMRIFPARRGNCEFSAAIMFPTQRGQINKNRYGHPQIHDSEELMQNGIFSTGDEFYTKT